MIKNNFLIKKFIWFLGVIKRVGEKLELDILRDLANLGKRAVIRYQIRLAKDDQIVAIIRDTSHKILQEALGQEIEFNQYKLKLALEEAEKRHIESKGTLWAKDIYERFRKGVLYNLSHESAVEKSDILEFNLDIEGLYNFYSLAQRRQSVRKFHSSRIPTDVIKTIIQCGIEAPSSCNRQSWRFITISRDTDKQFVADIRNIGFIKSTPLIICVLVNDDVYRNAHERNITAIMDASAATMNIITACEACGLGSCWINFLASVSPESVDVFKKHFNIRENVRPMTLIAVGDSAQSIEKPRRDEIDQYWLGSY